MRWLFIAGLLLTAQHAAAGGMTSSGGEWITEEENPWFIGPRPVRYCLEKAAGFSPTVAKSRATIAAVLSDWRGALTKLHPRPTSRALPDGQAKTLTLAFVEEPCRDSTELIFHFGSTNDDIESALRQHARYTLALALQTGIDEATGRVRQGHVWLAPDLGEHAYAGPHAERVLWANDRVLFAVLLHEVGHMFGFAHTATGFMQKSYPADVARQPPRRQPTAALLADESWWELDQIVCGLVEATPELLLGQPVRTGDRLCLKPGERGPTLYGIEVLFPTTSGSAQDQKAPGDSGSAPAPIGWPTAAGVATDADRIAGNYVSTAGGTLRPLFWEHTFVAVPSHFRLRGYATAAGVTAPLLLEQQGDTVDLILPAGNTFAVTRLVGIKTARP